jgi:LPPG:FO 2-phospho-L-lactate transferase
VSAASIAWRYGDLLDGYVVDHADADAAVHGPRLFAACTLMNTLADRDALAHVVLGAAAELRP